MSSTRLTVHLSNGNFELLTIKGSGKGGSSWNARFNQSAERLSALVVELLPVDRMPPAVWITFLLGCRVELDSKRNVGGSYAHLCEFGSFSRAEIIALAEACRYFQESPETTEEKLKKLGIPLA